MKRDKKAGGDPYLLAGRPTGSGSPKSARRRAPLALARPHKFARAAGELHFRLWRSLRLKKSPSPEVSGDNSAPQRRDGDDGLFFPFPFGGLYMVGVTPPRPQYQAKPPLKSGLLCSCKTTNETYFGASISRPTAANGLAAQDPCDTLSYIKR